MKSYEIIDAEQDRSIGILLYYPKEKSFLVELKKGLDEWTAPLLLTSFVKKGIYTIPRDASLLWVQERIIPGTRQNIGSILQNHRLKAYDEMKFLEISGGKCAQDNLFIRPLEVLPDWLVKRRQRNLEEVLLTGNKTLICFFQNKVVTRIALEQMKDMEAVSKILGNESLYRSGKLGTDGYFVTFNDSIDLPANLLYQRGTKIPLQLEDFLDFSRNNLWDTQEACMQLACSRQNIGYMLKRGELTPVKKDVKGNLYLKGKVLEHQWH